MTDNNYLGEVNESAVISHELIALVIQYRDDLKRPPSGDSLERRLEAIEAVIEKIRTP